MEAGRITRRFSSWRLQSGGGQVWSLPKLAGARGGGYQNWRGPGWRLPKWQEPGWRLPNWQRPRATAAGQHNDLDPSAEWGATQRPQSMHSCEWHPSRARRFPHLWHRTTATAAWFQNETPLTHNRPPWRAWATAMPPTPTHASPYIRPLGWMDLRVDRSRSVQWRCRPWNAPSAGRWPLVVEEALRRCTLEISPSKVPPNAPSGESTTAQRVACPTCHQACTELLYSAAPRATWAWCSRDGCHAPDPSRACIASGEARMCLTAWIWWAALATWAGKNTCGFGVFKILSD